jgi:hypothetical protein
MPVALASMSRMFARRSRVGGRARAAPPAPEPLRDQDSTPHDGELVVVGRAVADAGDRPTVVAGDLTDVAWSRITELFLKLSRLLLFT